MSTKKLSSKELRHRCLEFLSTCDDEPMSESDVEAIMRNSVKDGFMREVSPGRFSLTDKGREYVDFILARPEDGGGKQ